MSQLIGHLLFTVLASASPLLCITVFTVKQAFGNHGLLPGYGAKPIGAGLGRDTITYNQIKNSMRRENFEKMNKHKVLLGFKSRPPVNYWKSFLLRGN